MGTIVAYGGVARAILGTTFVLRPLCKQDVYTEALDGKH